MGGVTTAYTDRLSINFSNPASYSSFETVKEIKSKKLVAGRAILDVGMDFESRSLLESSPPRKFVASNALFSYVYVGVPIRQNWGMVFGLRPLSRISYKQVRHEILFDPNTGQRIDSADTRFEGDGGSYLASIGTGFDVFRKDKRKSEEKLSIGFNVGYFFGKKDYSTKRSLINDTVLYYQANYETKTSFGGIYADAGLLYKLPLDTANLVSLTIGASGNWGQKISASQDVLRETFVFDDNLGDVRLDSISEQKSIKGKINMPTSFNVGFMIQRLVSISKTSRKPGWIMGADFSMQNWSSYRFYGQKDSVKNSWEARVGGQYNPVPKNRNYFSNITYRAGFFMGSEYILVGGKNLNRFGGTFGLGLPVAINRQAPNQFTLLNLAFEYGKRGNSNNLLHENMFRFSVGFSLSDIWFGKRKYD